MASAAIVASAASTLVTVVSSGVAVVNALSSLQSNAKTYGVVHVHERLDTIDLMAKLKQSHALIKDLNQKEQQQPMSSSMAVAIHNLQDIYHRLQKELERVESQIIEHQQKWFTGYRSIYIDENLRKIDEHSKILDMRFHTLLLIQTASIKAHQS